MPRESIDRNPPQEALPQQEDGETIDPSKWLVTFTGQGSQFAGMGKDLYENSEAAREVFHEADRIVGLPLSEIMFEGPEETLKETAIAQMAIVTFDEAARRATEALFGKDLEPKAFLGHSLGNFESAVASGAAPFSKILLLVQERGRLMQKAANKNPGSMAAIMGLDLNVLKGICDETGAEIGIVNTDNQVVITGGKRAVAQAIDLASDHKARRITPLTVSAAFHSSLMKEAQEDFKKVIFETPFTDPRRPVISNSTGEPLTTAKEIQMDLLQGICGIVFYNKAFIRGIEGASATVEIGPKDILTGIAKQIKRDIRRDIRTFTVDSFESAQKLARLIQQPDRNPQAA